MNKTFITFVLGFIVGAILMIGYQLDIIIGLLKAAQ